MPELRKVEDAFPVLQQWAFLAHDRAEALAAAISHFYRARRDLNAWRLSMPQGEWSVAAPPEALALTPPSTACKASPTSS